MYNLGATETMPDFSQLEMQDVTVVDTLNQEYTVEKKNVSRFLDEHTGIVFEGFIHVPSSDSWFFELENDDGAQLFIDGQ